MRNSRLVAAALLLLICMFRGHSFFSTNAELLEAYSNCETAADVIAAQNAWLEQATSGRRDGLTQGSHRSTQVANKRRLLVNKNGTVLVSMPGVLHQPFACRARCCHHIWVMCCRGV